MSSSCLTKTKFLDEIPEDEESKKVLDEFETFDFLLRPNSIEYCTSKETDHLVSLKVSLQDIYNLKNVREGKVHGVPREDLNLDCKTFLL